MHKKSYWQSGLPRRSSSNRKAEAGEIATIIALGSMVFILITTVATSLISKNPNTINSRADVVSAQLTIAAKPSATTKPKATATTKPKATATTKPGSGASTPKPTSQSPGDQSCKAGLNACPGKNPYCRTCSCSCANGCNGISCKPTPGPNGANPNEGNPSPTPTKTGGTCKASGQTCSLNQDCCSGSCNGTMPNRYCGSGSSSGSSSSPTSGSSSNCNCPPAGGAKYGWLSFGKCICTNCFCRGSGGSAYCASNSGNNQYQYVDPSNCCPPGNISTACANASQTQPTQITNECSKVGGSCADSCNSTQTPQTGAAQRYCSVNNLGSQCCKRNSSVSSAPTNPPGCKRCSTKEECGCSATEVMVPCVERDVYRCVPAGQAPTSSVPLSPTPTAVLQTGGNDAICQTEVGPGAYCQGSDLINGPPCVGMTNIACGQSLAGVVHYCCPLAPTTTPTSSNAECISKTGSPNAFCSKSLVTLDRCGGNGFDESTAKCDNDKGVCCQPASNTNSGDGACINAHGSLAYCPCSIFESDSCKSGYTNSGGVSCSCTASFNKKCCYPGGTLPSTGPNPTQEPTWSPPQLTMSASLTGSQTAPPAAAACPPDSVKCSDLAELAKQYGVTIDVAKQGCSTRGGGVYGCDGKQYCCDKSAIPQGYVADTFTTPYTNTFTANQATYYQVTGSNYLIKVSQ